MGEQDALHIPFRCLLEHPHWILGERFNLEGPVVYMEVNVGILETEVLITPVKLE